MNFPKLTITTLFIVALATSNSIFSQETVKVSIVPKTVERGETDLVLFSFEPKTGCDQLEGKSLKVDPDNDSELREKGISITTFTKVSKDGVNACKAFARVRVEKEAKLGVQNIKLVAIASDKDGKDFVIPSLTITVTKAKKVTPGPIPPGLAPQVDILWGVIPNGITKANFGGKVAKEFYAVEIVIGNNTGFDLQIAAVGFKLGPIGKAATVMAETRKSIARQYRDLLEHQIDLIKQIREKKKSCVGKDIKDCTKNIKKLENELLTANNQGKKLIFNARDQAKELRTLSQIAYKSKVPVSSYAITRGTASHSQLLSWRKASLGILRALGPIFTSLNPFFGAAKEPKITQVFNIITNPLAEGLDSVFPDLKINQLQRLDDQALRDGMIIQNNRQIRTRVFIPKKTLRLEKKYKNDVSVITQSLGDLHIVGDQIEYLNRVSVTSSPSGEITPPPTVNPTNANTFKQGDSESSINVTGTNLEGAIISGVADGITVESNLTKSTRTQASVPIKISDTAKPGEYSVSLRTPSGSQSIGVIVKREEAKPDDPTLKPIIDSEKIISHPTKPKTYTFSLVGKFLTGAKLTSSDGKLSVGKVEVVNQGTSLSVLITVPQDTEAGSYNLDLTNGAGKTQIVSLTVQKKPCPFFDNTAPATNCPTPPTITVTRFGSNGQGSKPTNNPEAPIDYDFLIDGNNLQFLDRDPSQVFKNYNLTFTTTDTQIKGRIKIPKNFVNADGKKNDSKFTPEFKLKDKDGQSVTFKIEVLEQPKIIITNANAIPLQIIPENGSATIILSGQNFTGVTDATIKLLNHQSTGWTVMKPVGTGTDTNLTLVISAPNPYVDLTTPLKIELSNSNKDSVEISVKIKKEK